MNNGLVIGFISTILLFLVSCDQPEEKSAFLEENTLSITKSEISCTLTDLDLFSKTRINKDSHSIKILDADKDSILFITNVKRKKNRGPEGILSQTESLYLYNVSEDSILELVEFDEVYVSKGCLFNDMAVVLGIKLDGSDMQYSIYSFDKGKNEVLHQGNNSRHFSMWPKFVRVNSELILLEPQVKVGESSMNIEEISFFKLKDKKFERAMFHIPGNYRLLSTDESNNGNEFATYWENTNDNKAYFIIADSKGIKRIIPLPEPYKLINFALSNHFLIVSAQVGDKYRYKLLVFDLNDEVLYSKDYVYIPILQALPSSKKVIMADLEQSYYLAEFQDGELAMKHLMVEGNEYALKSDRIRFQEFNQKLILNFRINKRVMELEY